MFRSAAEWLLFEQGYESGMLNDKLRQLSAQLDIGSAPQWATTAKPVLDVLRRLGNLATHPNGGDLRKHAHFDAMFYIEVQAAFEYLLEVVYEMPSRLSERLQKLQGPFDRSEDSVR
jgi:hypothetical protein